MSSVFEGWQIVLASQSPRRRDLLTSAGVPYKAVVSNFGECQLEGESPEDYVVRNATGKAKLVSEQMGSHAGPVLVLGADTVVVFENEILEKPADQADGRRMLRALSGKTHYVLSGVSVIGCRSGKIHSRSICQRTAVTFAEIDDRDLEVYLRTEEPYDKSGAYALQGGGARFVRGVNGSVSNVIGLPLCEVLELLHAVVDSLE